MRVKVWGARGSVPSPGPETSRYGGNTSCVQVTLADGTMLVLDAGTGIRNLGSAVAAEGQRLNVLLTHLHMDHIQGLMFFAPLFRQTAEIAIWGPAAPGAEPLLDRIGALHLGAALPARGRRSFLVACRDGTPRIPNGGSARRRSRRARSCIAAPRSAIGSPRETSRSATCPTTSHG